MINTLKNISTIRIVQLLIYVMLIIINLISSNIDASIGWFCCIILVCNVMHLEHILTRQINQISEE